MVRLALACALAVPSAAAWGQEYEKEFEAFRQAQEQEFDTFRNEVDAEFETFLREAWQEYKAFAPEPVPSRPEPPVPVTFDRGKPLPVPVAIKPGLPKVPDAPMPGLDDKVPVDVPRPDLPPLDSRPAPGVYVPGQPYTPVLTPVPVPPRKPGERIRRTSVTFYGTDFDVCTTVVEDLRLKGVGENDVADAWRQVCSREYEQLVKDCMDVRREKRLNDWGYLAFTKQIGEQLYGPERTDDIAFLQMFLLSKSGYRVRLAKVDEGLKLLVATAGTIYGTPYLQISGAKYYVFEPRQGASMSIYTYRQDFAESKNLVNLSLEDIPELDLEPHERVFRAKESGIEVRTVVNANLMDFYRDYPQCDLLLHYKAPMSEELREELYRQLREAVSGKAEEEAAGLLLEFVQTAFDYRTDGEQFGYEKPFFPDETFYYPYCDCEDRAMLYATLVHDLLGLDVVLLDYPNHIASAVRFKGEVRGDHLLLKDGGKYLICDPTYIGAPIGQCMEQYRTVSPGIIR